MSRKGPETSSSPEQQHDTGLLLNKTKKNQPSGRIGEDTALNPLDSPSPPGSSHSRKQVVTGEKPDSTSESPEEVPWELRNEQQHGAAQALVQEKKGGGRKKLKAKNFSNRSFEGESSTALESPSSQGEAGGNDEEFHPGAYSVQPGAGGAAERQDPGFISPHEQEQAVPSSVQNVNENTEEAATPAVVPVKFELKNDLIAEPKMYLCI